MAAQVNTALLLKNLPPHLRNMIVNKGGRAMPIHTAAAVVQVGRQVGAPAAGSQAAPGSPQVLGTSQPFCIQAHRRMNDTPLSLSHCFLLHSEAGGG